MNTNTLAPGIIEHPPTRWTLRRLIWLHKLKLKHSPTLLDIWASLVGYAYSCSKHRDLWRITEQQANTAMRGLTLEYLRNNELSHLDASEDPDVVKLARRITDICRSKGFEPKWGPRIMCELL